MVSFRFHLVSVMAVFLALALGIGMGVTVIDKATVDLLQQRLDSVRSEVSSANQRSDELQSQVARSNAFEAEATQYLTDGRLRQSSVVVLAMRGIDEGPVNETVAAMTDAGANVIGTLWFTERARLEDPAVVASMRSALGAPDASPEQLRQAVLARISAVTAGATEPAGLAPFADAQIIQWQRGTVSDLDEAGFASSRLVLASGASSAAPNDLVARPLSRLLASQPNRRLVAVESGRDPSARTSGERAIFLGSIRSDNALDDRLSTVDNIETPAGRVATVLALAQLPGRTGDYGTGSGVQGIIPPFEPR